MLTALASVRHSESESKLVGGNIRRKPTTSGHLGVDKVGADYYYEFSTIRKYRTIIQIVR